MSILCHMLLYIIYQPPPYHHNERSFVRTLNGWIKLSNLPWRLLLIQCHQAGKLYICTVFLSPQCRVHHLQYPVFAFQFCETFGGTSIETALLLLVYKVCRWEIPIQFSNNKHRYIFKKWEWKSKICISYWTMNISWRIQRVLSHIHSRVVLLILKYCRTALELEFFFCCRAPAVGASRMRDNVFKTQEIVACAFIYFV